MSQLTWVADPAEVSIGKWDIPVSILVGMAEVEGHGCSLTMVVHSDHLDVVMPLTAAQAEDLGRVLSGVSEDLRSVGGAS